MSLVIQVVTDFVCQDVQGQDGWSEVDRVLFGSPRAQYNYRKHCHCLSILVTVFTQICIVLVPSQASSA